MNQKVVILGAGESGVGAALLAKARGYDYLLSDAGKIALRFQKEIRENQLNHEQEGHSEDEVLSADLIVKSPGIPDKAPLIRKAVEKGIPVISEIEFAYRHIDKSKRIIAITGTNGKTTTTLLTHHLCKACGYNAALGGNIGHSFARLAVDDNHDYYVLEVSSFQLDGIDSFKPDIAILLNITPDHLDRYDYQFEKYVSSKFRIIRNMGKEEVFIYFSDNQPVVQELNRRNVEASLFAISLLNPIQKGGYLEQDHLVFKFEQDTKKIPTSEVTLIGKHNMINTIASVLSLMQIGAPLQRIVKGLKSFVNAPHRLEEVAEISGVRYVNDSKATNTDAVFYALDGIEQPIIWIAGGVDKGNDYSSLDKLVKRKVKALVCMGKDNSKLMDHYGERVPAVSTASLKKAIKEATALAEKGDLVLLSPACASFDLFKNYEDRGDQFREEVLALRDKVESKNKSIS
ncbi:MAG: UDP-N-acetylmuramoyl-L-alanine--D-glutamate ligase [Cyclobacteriaceae bacterium]